MEQKLKELQDLFMEELNAKHTYSKESCQEMLTKTAKLDKLLTDFHSIIQRKLTTVNLANAYVLQAYN